MTWKLTGTVLWGLLVAGVFLGLQFLTASVAGLHDDGYLLAVSTLVTTLVCVPLLFGIARLKKGSDLREYFALRPMRTRTLAAWVGITAPLLILSDGLSDLLGKPIVPQFMRLITATADPLWLLWLALMVHQQYDLYGIVTLFVLGTLFGLARLRTGSIYVPLTLHALTNVVAAAEAALIG